jgi:trimeric autotransporter adhesin
MRIKIYYLSLCLLSLVVLSCGDESDGVPSPPATSFTVDKTSGIYGETEFTFTINQVDCNSISLLPYGVENPSFGGVLVSSFKEGKAIIKFKYENYPSGSVFKAVVVSNNRSGDGKIVKNTYSPSTSITITSSQAEISEFTVPFSTGTTIDQNAKTINVSVPYNSVITKVKTEVTSLVASFKASDLSTVTVGSTVQKNGTTVNNFTSPLTYVVKSQDGSKTVSYIVTVNITPIEKLTSFKSISATATSGSAKNKALPVSVDYTTKTIVVYDTIGTPINKFDSITFTYELDGEFANAKYGTKKLADARLDLTSSKQVIVLSQDSVAGTVVTYNVYATRAPKLRLAFNSLNPIIKGNTTNFEINASVINGTTVAAIPTTATIDLMPGVTVGAIKANNVSFTSGGSVDYTQDVTFELTVTDSNIGGGITYTVLYTVKVAVK